MSYRNTRLSTILFALITLSLACSLFAPPQATRSPVATTPATEQSTGKPAVTAPVPTATVDPNAPPLEAELIPTAELDNYLPSAPLTVRFNQPMNPDSAQPVILTFPWAAGQQSWDGTFTELTFTPDSEGFAPGTNYELFISHGLRSMAGGAFTEAPQWNLQVQTRPQVISHTPANSQLSDRQPEIKVEFDRPMDTGSVSTAISVIPPVPYALAWQGEELEIQLEQPLTPGERYHFTLSANAQDRQGIRLGTDYRWDYTLPRLISSIQTPTYTDSQEPNYDLAVEFNYPVEMEAAANLIELSPPVPGSWEVVGRGLLFQSQEPLPPASPVSIRFSQDLPTENGELLPASSDFQFTTPPAIVETRPPDGAEWVDPLTIFEIFFSVPVDPTSIPQALEISPAAPGSFTWVGRSVQYDPDEPLLLNQTYTVTLGLGARMLDGSPLLDQPYSFSFTTGNYYYEPRTLTFGEFGPNAQVLDFNGRRAIQFAARPRSTVEFELYRFTLDQFLERYASNFRGVRGWEPRKISLDGTSFITRWTQQLGASGSGWNENIYEAIIPESIEAGLYALNMTSGDESDKLILVLTRNTVMVKQAEGELVSWVTDINGSSRPGARVIVYDRAGEEITQGRTDEFGVFRTQVARDPQPLIIVAMENEDLTGREIEGTDISLSGLSNEWMQGYNRWWMWWNSPPQAKDYAIYAYTDRPIYRPGQTVFFKAILRQDVDATLNTLSEGTPVVLRVRDTRDNVVQTFDLTTNAFGTVSGEFVLAEGAMLGDYHLEVEIDGQKHTQLFKVQDYRKPDYQVTVTTGSEHYLVNESITAEIDASYLFGQPVANAQISIQLYQVDPSRAYWFEDRELDDRPRGDWFSFNEPSTYTTDENGHFTYRFPATLGYAEDWSYSWNDVGSQRQTYVGIEATVDDGSHMTVSAFKAFTVYNASAIVSLDIGDFLKQPETPFTVHGEITRITGEPMPDRAMELELRAYSRHDREFNQVIQTLSFSTGPDGKGTTQVTIAEPGFYQLRLNSQDDAGHEIYTNQWVYVLRPGSTWADAYVENLAIVADRDTYAVGETASLIIESTFDGPGLLTLERGTTHRAIPVQLTAPVTLVEVPIQADDAPNIFVTINAWEAQDTNLTKEMFTNLPDSRLRVATVELNVPQPEKELQVSITASQDFYAPGDEAVYTIQVTDLSGQPVQAELSAALVDEAIFTLSEELSGDIFEMMYANRPNIVRTYHSLALEREIFAPGMGGGGGDGLGPQPRSQFPDTALWLPTIYTDESGFAEVRLNLPDSLTTWRLTVKATSRDDRFGENLNKVTTTKQTIIRPILPRQLTSGDQVSISALVHNYGDTNRALVASLHVEPWDPASSYLPLMISGPISQSIELEPGEVRILGWQVTALGAGEARVTAYARPEGDNEASPDIGDAVSLPLTVRPLAVPESSTQMGEFSGQLDTAIVIPEAAIPQSTVRIELSRSVAGSLLTGLEYLTGFPYGCVEQTMSRALPNAVIGRAFSQLGVGNPTLQADLPAKINAGLQRLYGYQHTDGGWGWWYDDESHDYQTAWVVFGLATTLQAGYEVDPGVIARGANWLVQNLNGMDVRTRAYALYSLAVAGHGELQATLDLAAQANDLDSFSQAGLALAANTLGEYTTANFLLDNLVESAAQRDGMVYWPTPHEDGHYYQKTMASSVRTTALVLDALVRIRPGHALEGGAVRWLMGQRGQQGWGTTNETAYAIIALTDHLATLEDITADAPLEIRLNGEVVFSGTLGRSEPVISLDISRQELSSGGNHLQVNTGSEARLFYLIHSQLYFAQTEVPAAGVVKVERLYLNPEDNQPLEKFTAGELVKVMLAVEIPDRGFFMIVEDQLPAGLEALNEALNTTSYIQMPYGEEPPYFWQELGYNNKEVHGDRVSFFISELAEGQHTFSYLARATHSGYATALPAEVYAMYDPTFWGRSASDVLEISPSIK